METSTAIIIAIIVSVIISLIICFIWRSKIKTAKIARTADNYIPQNGFILAVQADTFLYRTTSRRKIERSSSSTQRR